MKTYQYNLILSALTIVLSLSTIQAETKSKIPEISPAPVAEKAEMDHSMHQGMNNQMTESKPADLGFEQENLTPANIPMTDQNFKTEGFVTRFADKGALILSFTYANCETICPITNGILSAVDRELVERGGEDITIVTLSIDPENDTPEVLRESVDTLQTSDNWLWLTARPQDNSQLLDQLGIEVAALAEHDPIFLVGDVCTGNFTRLIGIPNPSDLVQLAANHQTCG